MFTLDAWVQRPSAVLVAQHENGDLRKIKVCVNLRKVGHPTLRNFPQRVKVCKGKFTRSALKGFVKLA